MFLADRKKDVKKIKITVCLGLALVLILSAFMGLMTGASSASAQARVQTVATSAALAPILADGDADTKVYTGKNKPLYYDVRDGTVLTQNGEIVDDNNSNPVYYNSVTQEFTNSKNDALAVSVRTSSRSGNYLSNAGKTVGSTAITDEFFEARRSDNTNIYIRVVFKEKIEWFKKIYSFDVFDLHGNKLQESNLHSDYAKFFKEHPFPLLVVFISPWLLLADLGMKNIVSSLADKYPKTTLSSLIKEIVYINPNAEILEPMDDRGVKITVFDGQLFDHMDFPLIGVDSKPLFFDGKVYYGIDGRVLSVSSDGYLMDGDTKVHSVITDLEQGKFLYFLFMWDRVTICPLLGEPRLNADGKYVGGGVDCSYLNGDLIDEKDFVIPNFSVEDIWARYPETKPTVSATDILDDFFGGIGEWFSDFFSSIGNVLYLYRVHIVLGLIALLLVITSFWWIPLLYKLIKLCVKGFVAFITLPIKLSKGE